MLISYIVNCRGSFRLGEPSENDSWCEKNCSGNKCPGCNDRSGTPECRQKPCYCGTKYAFLFLLMGFYVEIYTIRIYIFQFNFRLRLWITTRRYQGPPDMPLATSYYSINLSKKLSKLLRNLSTHID